MSEEKLKEIWQKYVEGKVIPWYDLARLWFNTMGWFGFGYVLAMIVSMIMFNGTKTDIWLVVFSVTATLFVGKNIDFFENLYKKAFYKLFPKGIVLPYIDRTIK